jgi:hypothetical protein
MSPFQTLSIRDSDVSLSISPTFASFSAFRALSCIAEASGCKKAGKFFEKESIANSSLLQGNEAGWGRSIADIQQTCLICAIREELIERNEGGSGEKIEV